MALLNKFFADEPNNANMITIPATMKISANFHSEMFWKLNVKYLLLMYINVR